MTRVVALPMLGLVLALAGCGTDTLGTSASTPSVSAGSPSPTVGDSESTSDPDVCTRKDDLALTPAGVEDAAKGGSYVGYWITSDRRCTVTGSPRVSLEHRVSYDQWEMIDIPAGAGDSEDVWVSRKPGTAAVVLEVSSCDSEDPDAIGSPVVRFPNGGKTSALDQVPYCPGHKEPGVTSLPVLDWAGDFELLPATETITAQGVGEIRWDAYDPSMRVHQLPRDCLSDKPVPLEQEAWFQFRGAEGIVLFATADTPPEIHLSLYPNGSPRTAKGIGYGSTMAEVRRAYPGATKSYPYDGPNGLVAVIDGVPVTFDGPDDYYDDDHEADYVDTVLINSTYATPC